MAEILPMTKILAEQYPHLFGNLNKNQDQDIEQLKEENKPQTTKQDHLKSERNLEPNIEKIPSDVETPSKKQPDPELGNVRNEYDIDPSSFDLNFSEFPIAHLTKRLPKGISKTEISYSDWIQGIDGKLVERKWTVSSFAKNKDGKFIGIGGPTSLTVFYELMQIWKEQGIKDDKIHIGTYYGLLKRLGWGTGGINYNQLENDLHSIYGLEFVAENAYFDKERNKYVDKSFKPFIGWEMYKKHEIKDYMTDYGYIQVHPEFSKTFRIKSMYYLPFENEYFQKLTAHEKKVALYLSKVFNPYRKKVQSSYSRNIDDLCRQLPIYGDARKRKFYLSKACKGLIKKKFILLERFQIDESVITFHNRQQISLLPYLKINLNEKPQISVDVLLDEIMRVCGDEHSKNFYTIIAKNVPDDLIYCALSEARQEGKDPKRLFTKIIQEKAAAYLKPFSSEK